MRQTGKDLFSGYDLRELIDKHNREMLSEIETISGDKLLITDVEQWCNYFQQKYEFHTLKLRDEDITVDSKDADIDTGRVSRRDRNEPVYIKGTAITYIIPFEGDRNLFFCRPSSSNLNPPCALVNKVELKVIFEQIKHDAEALKASFNRIFGDIKWYLECIEKDISAHNASIRTIAKNKIEDRKKKLIKDKNLIGSLGYPISQRDDAPKTYEVPTIRKIIDITQPSPEKIPFVPEPTIDMKIYDQIISIINNMVSVIEKSPNSFKGMKEEDLRNHFLVQLNGQFKGQATGETFNFEGKTDILIHWEDKNIFIAECKFWSGPESLIDAVNQLLGYATWRDTKIALLIFNRDRQLSTVLTKIPEVIKSHPNFKRQLSYDSQTGFRFIIHHRDDPDRELILTILVFEVPV